MTPFAIDKSRANLAYLTLAAVVAFGFLAFFFGDKLSSSQLVLLTSIVMGVIGELKAAYAYIFDGVAGQGKKDDAPAGPGKDAPP